MIRIVFFIFSVVVFSCSPNKSSDLSQDSSQELKQIENEPIVSLSSDFEVWKKSNNVSIDISLDNVNDEVYTRSCLPLLVIYKENEDKPLYWSVLDLSNALNLGPQRYSVISLPAKKSKKLSPFISELKWARTDSEDWPYSDLYDLLEPGKYQLKLEINIYQEKEKTSEINSEAVSFVISE